MAGATHTITTSHLGVKAYARQHSWSMACMLAEMRLAIIRHIYTYEVFIVRSSRSELGQSSHYMLYDPNQDVQLQSEFLFK